MNHNRPPLGQRFEDLMYQSGLTAQGCWDEIDDYGREAIEKFAQLIVRECVEIALIDTRSTVNFEVSNRIAKHFGVE